MTYRHKRNIVSLHNRLHRKARLQAGHVPQRSAVLNFISDVRKAVLSNPVKSSPVPERQWSQGRGRNR